MLYKAKFLCYDTVAKCGNTLGFVVIRELFPVFRPCRYDGQARFIEWAFARYIEQFHLPFWGATDFSLRRTGPRGERGVFLCVAVFGQKGEMESVLRRKLKEFLWQKN